MKKSEKRFMRPAELCEHLRIGKSTLYDWLAKRHDFPKPIHAGQRVTLFDVDEVEKFCFKPTA